MGWVWERTTPETPFIEWGCIEWGSGARPKKRSKRCAASSGSALAITATIFGDEKRRPAQRKQLEMRMHAIAHVQVELNDDRGIGRG